MKTIALITSLVLTTVQPGVGNPLDLKHFELSLADAIKWEILWEESPTAIRIPANGYANAYLIADRSHLWYCSHQLGICAVYWTDSVRNWQSADAEKLDGTESDEKAAGIFAGNHAMEAARFTADKPRVVGTGGLTGFPA